MVSEKSWLSLSEGESRDALRSKRKSLVKGIGRRRGDKGSFLRCEKGGIFSREGPFIQRKEIQKKEDIKTGAISTGFCKVNFIP